MHNVRGKEVRVLAVCAVIFGALGWGMAPAAHADSGCAPDGLQDSGAVYRICMPAPGEWNGELVLFAHGYVAYNEPIAIPDDQLVLPGGLSIPEMVNDLGFAFAVTSYSVNGLAVRPAQGDLVDLVQIFGATHGAPGRVYLSGASEGGIITALALEQRADVFDGGLSTCGPVGDFRRQINYWGDVRVIFDYFFPGVLPGGPTQIPQEVIDNWETIYEPRLHQALRAWPARTQQLLRAAQVPQHPRDMDQNIQALLDLLWYNVFATNDGIARLGGQPFDNSHRWYTGSDNDWHLNRLVARFEADSAAVREIHRHYQTSGDLDGPLVTLHTVDPIVPYWHELLYRHKIEAQGDGALHTNIPIWFRYGHCNFTPAQVLLAFVVLVREVSGSVLLDAERVLPAPEDRDEYRALAADYGLLPGAGISLYLPVVPMPGAFQVADTR